jgi:hypothetical protein
MAARIQALLVGLALLGAGTAQAKGKAGGDELDQMTGLVRFLQDRITTEDPTLAPDLRHAALLDAIEMMGIELPEGLRKRPAASPEQLALAILTAPAPTPQRPTGAGPSGSEDPFEGSSTAGTSAAPPPPPPRCPRRPHPAGSRTRSAS